MVVFTPAVLGQPIFQQIVDFLGGIKYVPPPASQPKVEQEKKEEEERPKRGSAVAFEAGIELADSNRVASGWEQVGNWEFRAGEEAVTQEEAAVWCQGQGGSLA